MKGELDVERRWKTSSGNDKVLGGCIRDSLQPHLKRPATSAVFSDISQPIHNDVDVQFTQRASRSTKRISQVVSYAKQLDKCCSWAKALLGAAAGPEKCLPNTQYRAYPIASRDGLNADCRRLRSLYRRSLKLALDWSVHRYLWRGQALYIRSLFEANKNIRDPRQQRASLTEQMDEQFS